MKYHAYLAECIGTFSLTLLVALSLSMTILPTPVLAAATLGLFVYTVGGISGAHLNPAVTVALASVGKIRYDHATFYIIAQLLGANLAMVVASLLTGKVTALPVDATLGIGLAEALGAFLFLLGISAVVYGKVHSAASGLVIGGSLLCGIYVASTLGNGILNPAVAMGVGSLSLSYALGPIAGALAGVWTYRAIARE